jgi:hypothetical protein
MGRGVLRPKLPSADALAQRPDNRWCQHCKNWIHKNRFAQHCKTKHGIELEIVTAPTKLSSPKAASKAKRTPAKNQIWLKKDVDDPFPEPLYERQPRFEAGMRWEQGGSPGLGKRR